jgi:PAS domain S-box-containing protein
MSSMRSAIVFRSVFLQTLLPVLLTVVLFVSTLFLLILPFVESILMDHLRGQVKETATLAVSLLEDYETRVERGELTRDEAMRRAAQRIRELRYGPEGKDYFWITDLEPRMIVHPYRRDLEGKDVGEFRDPHGKRLFMEMVAAARAEGGGFVDYMWQWKDDPDRIVPKLSCVRLFESWGWIAGTGMYLDDVRADIAAIIRRITQLCAAILVIMVLLSAWISLAGLRNEMRRRKAERNLRENEARLRTILDNTSEIVYTLTEDGVFSFVSPAWTRLLGHDPEEVIGQHFPVFVHPDDIEACRNFLTRVYEEGSREEGIAYRARHKNGEWRWHESNGSLARTESGEPLYYVGVAQDITERLAHEAALRESEERHRTLVQTLPHGVGEIELDGRIRFANFSLHHIFEYEDGTLIGQNIVDLTPAGGDRARIEGYLCQLRTELPPPGTIIIRGLRKDRQDVDVQLDWNYRRGADGAVAGVIAVVTDISEKVQAEKEAKLRQQQLIQADKMVSLGILVSGVAHEINNPNFVIMTNISTLASMWEHIARRLDQVMAREGDFSTGGMKYSEVRENIPELFDTLLDSSERIQLIVQELRDFARQGPAELNEWIDINAVVSSSVTLVSNMVRKKTDNFHVEYRESVPPVRGNHRRLEQVVINLVQNACQALPDRHRGLWVETDFHKGPAHVIIAVTDEGAGIPEEDLKHITDPFFTTKRDSGGTGLGLSISAAIVEEHGGSLAFESTPGQGTTARIILPAETP